MNKISIKGVLIGGLVDIVTSVILGISFAIYGMSKVNMSPLPKDGVATTMATAIHTNGPLYVAQLLVGLGCSVLGGYIAAWLAKRNELLNGALSSFLCVSLGIFTMASGKSSDRFWVQILLLVASPAMALLGGELMRRWRRAPPARILASTSNRP
jgi:hypothetical protein